MELKLSIKTVIKKNSNKPNTKRTKEGNILHTYGIIEFFTSNPILYLALIVFALFFIGLAVFFIIIYFGYNRPKEENNNQNALVKDP